MIYKQPNNRLSDKFLTAGKNNWHFYFSIIVTLNSNPCLFHYKSLVIFYCFTWLFSLAGVKANSAVLLKKRLWLSHLFMTLLSTATQTQLYRTKDFHGLKFAANLQHALFFFEFFRWSGSGGGARAAFPFAHVSRWNVLIIHLKAVELRFSFKLCCCF